LPDYPILAIGKIQIAKNRRNSQSLAALAIAAIIWSYNGCNAHEDQTHILVSGPLSGLLGRLSGLPVAPPGGAAGAGTRQLIRRRLSRTHPQSPGLIFRLNHYLSEPI